MKPRKPPGARLIRNSTAEFLIFTGQDRRQAHQLSQTLLETGDGPRGPQGMQKSLGQAPIVLKGEIRTRGRRNVQACSFADMLEQTLQRYRNRAIEAAQVLEELIELAKHMREADRRGEDLGLTEDELAFYDALETNDSAVAILGDETLRGIARELVEAVRTNTTSDWSIRENVRAELRVIVKRILRKYGYPPDKQAKATQTVLEQAELLTDSLTQYSSKER